jgi:hypothetical protein
MFPSRTARNQAIRTLARSVERESTRRPASAEFYAWLTSHKYVDRQPPIGNRSRTIAWSAAEQWPGSIEWYILDDSVIGVPEHRTMFYEIPFADLARMPSVADPYSGRRERRHRSSETRDR